MKSSRHYDRIFFEDESLPLCIHYDTGEFQPSPQREPFSWHEQIELLWVRRGEIAVYCSERPFLAKAGELVVINPNQMHRVEHEGGEVGYHCLMLDAALYGDSGPCQKRYFDLLSQNRLCFENLLCSDDKAVSHVEALCGEWKEKKPFYELAVKEHVLGLFSCLFRRHLSEGVAVAQMAQNVRQYHRIRPALEYMSAHLSQHITLEQLAASCNLSPAHFCRVFRGITSTAPMQYLTQLRLDRAAQLLKQGDQSVAEIAWETGFEDAGYLSRRFKEKYGLTPRGLRKK